MVDMTRRVNHILFALLSSAIRGTNLSENERMLYSPKVLEDLLKIGQKYDITHLIILALQQNGLFSPEDREYSKIIFKVLYRYEQQNQEYKNLCEALEAEQIPFIPLKGSVIRKYYPEAWMRTSCDIDILVHPEDLDRTLTYLKQNLQYIERARGTHDILLFSPLGIHVEIHFDLVEEGRANNAIEVLRSVWEDVSLRENSEYWYEMSDEFFYFYHIAHMAKHFESGGCGIRPFMDLWILDHIEGANQSGRDELLQKGDLLRFADTVRTLSKVWFDGTEADNLSLQLQAFLLNGGAYGSSENKVALQQTKKGGRFGYVLSRVFIPIAKLKRYYPILDKYPWMMPFMQIRRWFMLLRPDVAQMAKKELETNRNIEKSHADEMNIFLHDVGLK